MANNKNDIRTITDFMLKLSNINSERIDATSTQSTIITPPIVGVPALWACDFGASS